MNRIACFVMALLLLSGCAANPNNRETSSSAVEEHEHVQGLANNIVEHEEVAYCGNTQTTLRKMDGRNVVWETSFMYADSVALTDLLRWLDYREGMCRCLPEYQVDTEFGGVYGINLSEGYVRYGDAQVQLTDEQLEQVRGIIHANTPPFFYPIAREKEA